MPKYTIIISESQRKILETALDAYDKDSLDGKSDLGVSTPFEASMMLGMIRDLPIDDAEAGGDALHDFTA